MYLAGPEVFLPSALEILALKSDILRCAGYEPVAPLDNHIEPQGSRHAMGMAIYRSNIALMDSCEAVIANLTPFRGVGADPGTAFELGYMTALGRRALAYTNIAVSHAARSCNWYRGEARLDEAGELRGPDGLSIENFDMTDNLMLAGAAEVMGAPIVARQAPVGKLYTDLRAFHDCVLML